jgi:CheY-like chemotaxis protein/DNA-directed RNA polymerase specialized sigma24 family protein
MTAFQRDDLIRALPYARRYARALTGSQPAGDALVADCLRATLDPAASALDDGTETLSDARHVLYRGVTRRFEAGGGGHDTQDGLTVRQRQLLLLTSLEDVSAADAAPILGIAPGEAEAGLADARDRLRATTATDVLIIEDEPIIAMDLEELVQSCGHRVVGVAATETEAIALAKRTRPGLILADINLGLGGDGSNAVSAILAVHFAPVIFVTAYPERLLTGDAIEPAFVITKPFEPLTLAIATYQAVTGGVQLDRV